LQRIDGRPEHRRESEAVARRRRGEKFSELSFLGSSQNLFQIVRYAGGQQFFFAEMLDQTI
jgi:hypothetical protein